MDRPEDDAITARWDALIKERRQAKRSKDRKRIDRAMAELIRETLRLHPEDFTLCPDGRWRSNEFVTKQ